MENASKALIIAGEILIGVIILSIMVLVFNKVNVFTEAYYENSEKQKLITFNAKYTKYITNNTVDNATYIYAEDVVTLANQAMNWNNTTQDTNEIITVTIITDNETITLPTDSFSATDFLKKYKLRGEPSEAGYDPSLEEYKFSCEVTLNGPKGRVDAVEIVYVP